MENIKTAEESLEEVLGSNSDLSYTVFKALREAMKEYAQQCHENYMRELRSRYDFETTLAEDIFYSDIQTP